MSHNKIKVAGQSPNSSSEISVQLNNLSDVNVTSATNGTLLKYVTSEWVGGNPGFETTDYVLAASNKTTGSVSTVYDTVSANSITTDSRNSGYGRAETKGSASIYGTEFQSGTSSSNSLRYNGFTLPANAKFLLILVHVARFNNSAGQTVLQWMDENDNTLGPQIQVKDGDRGSKKLFGYIETGGTSVEVFPTCIDTNNHKRQNKSDGDSWQAVRIG